MLQNQRCEATTRSGGQCKNRAIRGFPYCAIHVKKAYGDKVHPRRKLTRSHIIALIEDNNNTADGLDLTFADISDEILESSIVPMPSMNGVVLGRYGAILSGTIAHRTVFQRTMLSRAKLTYGDFKEANFYRCDLTYADLRFAKFDEASFAQADLSGANLCGSSFRDTNFRGANLSDADLYLARFSGDTRLSKDMFGANILQEDEQKYKAFIIRSILPDSNSPLESHLRDRHKKAASIYRQLRIHFTENGKLDDARWAFLRERRMAKIASGRDARRNIQQGQILSGVRLGLNWLSDWVAELLCDYGESTWRVIFWLAGLLLVIGPTAISLCGGLIWPREEFEVYHSIQSPLLRWLYGYLQYLLYTLDTLTASDYAPLIPGNGLVRLASGLLALFGIFLAGLLGFVAGNRIRKL